MSKVNKWASLHIIKSPHYFHNYSVRKALKAANKLLRNLPACVQAPTQRMHAQIHQPGQFGAFLFTINFAVKMFHSGLSPFYWSCVMCAPSLRDAVIAAVPVPFTERVGPDTHSSCIYLQFPLIWFDLRSKPVVIKTGFCLQNTARRGTRAKIQGKPWWSAMALRRAHGRAGAERSGLLSSGSLWWGWKRHLGCQLSVSRIFFFFKTICG